jgi:alkanesulfonate monooxygenase SsuD/methylene tetrahydromethanopterin reductase-like flavin-dependent oxidoreductase (luciferase family)
VLQAKTAEQAGFDGITVSEHHAGLSEYLPNPIMAVTWLLCATQQIWGAPCPLLLPLRSPALVAEDIAWLAARFPGRVGAGFAPGSVSTPDDYRIGDVSIDDRRRIFAKNLPIVVRALQGQAPGPLGLDHAVKACGTNPVPCVSTVGGPLGAKRAARVGVGILTASSSSLEEARRLIQEYRSQGGAGPCVINRRAWLGKPDPRRVQSLTAAMEARAGATKGDPHNKPDVISSENPDDVALELADAIERVGATAINIKCYFPVATPPEMREQLHSFGRQVLPSLRRLLARALPA